MTRKRNTNEILNDNGEVIGERNRVLDKWKNDLSELLNPNSKSAADTDSVDLMVNIERNIDESGLFENCFSLSEVRKNYIRS